MTTPIVINIPGAKLLSSRGSGSNGRQHHHARAKDISKHRSGANARVSEVLGSLPGYACTSHVLPNRRERTSWYFVARRVHGPGEAGEPFPARSVTLTRLCPKRYFCDGADNLRSLFKATLDGVADALGVNDKVFVDNPNEAQLQNGRIGIRYEQIDGPWGVRITIEPADRAPDARAGTPSG